MNRLLQTIRRVLGAAAMTILLALPAVSAAETSGATTGRSAGPAFTNRLIDAQAPYLLLHAHNPVDWYPWGPEAFARAKAEDKPIFLSVGYSTCFWCHVAERTLYRDPGIAALMNKWFINVKVDREQRPDVDHVYMLARQIIAGSGGWPNNVFLTPDLEAFFAGSYFPPERDERGRPSFPDVLERIHDAWTQRRGQVLQTANQVEASLRQVQAAGAPATTGVELDAAAVKNDAIRALLRGFDPVHGGFGGRVQRTKFPQSPALQLLLTEYRQSRDQFVAEALQDTLDAIAYGGIHDHLAGGFHRYSTDPQWSVPHFEKMLYDNAQLLRIYAEAHELFGKRLYRDTAERIAHYLTQRMLSPQGGFYTAEDAQVDGVEGASYVWSYAQIEAVLGKPSADRLLAVYALEPVPHSAAARRAADAPIPEDGGVLRVRLPIEAAVRDSGSGDGAALLRSLAPLRATLLAQRDRRKPPLRDEKIGVHLNGLAIAGFADAGRALGNPRYVEVARRSADYLWKEAFDPATGSLRHQIFNGKASGDGFLSDHANLANGLLALYRVTGEAHWRERAARLMDTVLERFIADDGLLRLTLAAAELPVQPVDHGDVESPSGTSATLTALIALARGDDGSAYADGAARVLRRLAAGLRARPDAWPALLSALAAPAAKPVVLTANAATAATAGSGVAATDVAALKSTLDFVRVDARTDEAGARVVITIAVDRGFHINANPATLDFLIPTQVTFNGVTPTRISYPEAKPFRPGFTDTELAVYEGDARIVAHFDAADLAKLAGTRATVTAQACNETVCYPPSTISVAIGK